jgi:anti-sigma B factor antagonist
MPISFISKMEEGFGILELAGSLTLGPSLRDLRENVRKVLADTKLNGLIVNVAEVSAIDSAGLGELTVLYTLASKRGCPVRLVGVSPGLRKMLELTRLDVVLPAAEDIQSAKKVIRAG